jgi:TRAP-type C4-dicarboxylate transport system substrate-binding protein
MTHRALVAAACAIAATASACGGTGDKAGGDLAGGEPVTLTIAAYSESERRELVDAMRRLLGGSVELRVMPPRHATRADYETSAVADIRRGALDLAIVDARTLDRAGLTGFRAVLAPFLVDSLGLEERVLDGPVGERMLGAVDGPGLVGVGLIPGPLRRPVGFARSMSVVGDFRRSIVGTVPFSVADRTFRALGAQIRAAGSPRDVGTIDGADLTVTELDLSGYDTAARSIAADVVFWPHVLVVVANTQRLRSLGPARQALLRRASRQAIAPAVERIRTQELAGLARICERDVAALVTTSPRQKTALRRTVQPVYGELGRDQLAFDLIHEIERLRGTSGPDVLRCARAGAPTQETVAGRLDGTWEWSVTKAELRAVGDTPAGIVNNAGRWRLAVGDGRFELRGIDAGDVYRGSFVVDGDRIVARLDGLRTPDPSWQYTWSLYRGRLMLSPVEGAAAAAQVVAKPLIRVD